LKFVKYLVAYFLTDYKCDGQTDGQNFRSIPLLQAMSRAIEWNSVEKIDCDDNLGDLSILRSHRAIFKNRLLWGLIIEIIQSYICKRCRSCILYIALTLITCSGCGSWAVCEASGDDSG